MLIAEKITVLNDEEIQYEGGNYFSEFGSVEEIAGDLRLKKRNYNKDIPIVTMDFIITDGDFSNPDIVSISSRGNGNYYWKSKQQPTGSLVVYHLIPANSSVQSQIDMAKNGNYVEITGQLSKNNEIKNETGYFIRLMHSNHKFILANDVRIFE